MSGAAWLGRAPPRLAPPERLPAPRRGESSSGMWKGTGSQEPEAVAVECRAALDELGRLAAGYQQLALGVGSFADPLRWRLALQEGGRPQGFGSESGRAGGPWRMPRTGVGVGRSRTLDPGGCRGEAAFFPHCPSFMEPLGLGRMLPGWGWGSGCPYYIPGSIIPA